MEMFITTRDSRQFCLEQVKRANCGFLLCSFTSLAGLENSPSDSTFSPQLTTRPHTVCISGRLESAKGEKNGCGLTKLILSSSVSNHNNNNNDKDDDDDYNTNNYNNYDNYNNYHNYYDDNIYNYNNYNNFPRGGNLVPRASPSGGGGAVGKAPPPNEGEALGTKLQGEGEGVS